MAYITKRYKPSHKDLVCEFQVKPARDKTFEEAIESVAGESSIGTWTHVTTMDPRTREKLKPTAYDLDAPYCKIAYPQELFEPNNVPQILSAVAGNIFGMNDVAALRLEDIDFPDKVIKAFKGPKFGIDGVRKMVGIKKRPLLGTIVKPKLGLTPAGHASVASEAWLGGLDVVKDDENLTNQTFNKFKERMEKTFKAMEKVEKTLGEKKIYMPNITAETKTMLERAKIVKKMGGTHIMIDVLTAGFSALQTIRDADLGMAIHAHRAGHATFTRVPDHGISMLTIAKLCRLIGVDQLHIGTVVGKMFGSASEILAVEREIESRLIQENSANHVLNEDWHKIKPVFAVASGGLHPGLIGPLVNLMGNDIIIQAGGGVHGHTHGTRAGAIALRQSLDAALQGIEADIYAETHQELYKALQQWGHVASQY